MTKTINERGFHELVGETIDFIDTTAINVAHIHTKSGKVISIDAEASHHGIPVVQVGEGYEQT